MAKRILFTVQTPLGYRVVLTRDRWRQIVRLKHPAVANRENDVHECLDEPDFIRASAKDPNVHLYYRRVQKQYLCIVVAPGEGNEYFVVTSYFTRRAKQGPVLWTK